MAEVLLSQNKLQPLITCGVTEGILLNIHSD